MGEKILASLEPIMRIGSHTVHVTGSLGIALFPADGEDIATLQKNADVALYKAKDAGKNRCLLYHQAMNFQASEQLVLENGLRQALQRNEFRVFYQPVLDLKTGVIVGVESLLRWHHPAMGLLSPLKFIPLAEEIGLIVPLGKWVIRRTLQDMLWLRQRGWQLSAAINVSSRQFTDGTFVETVLEAVKKSGLPPDSLELELTESMAMENLEHTKNILRTFSAYGIGITVDDFGTGYSSLNYLKRFPIQKLKIDKTFVRHCITDEHDTSIIKAIISMAKSLNLKIIAEGVDSETQLNLLRSLGCDGIQGYYVSRPLTRSELAAFLESRLPAAKALPAPFAREPAAGPAAIA
jgi:EAL domain-containing protein (putative c-di-GMP-specific phosphodiesterase class I)